MYINVPLPLLLGNSLNFFQTNATGASYSFHISVFPLFVCVHFFQRKEKKKFLNLVLKENKKYIV